jgi:hypothetical protein
MKRAIPFLAVVLLMAGCKGGGGQSSSTAKPAAPRDPRVAAIQERVDKTTPEAKQIIQEVQAIKPEVNEQPSGKTLGEIVETYSKNNGAYNILPIGWEANKKKNGRWKIAYNYQDWQKQILLAEWEYIPETKKLYPFEFQNAKEFWSAPETADKPKGKK